MITLIWAIHSRRRRRETTAEIKRLRDHCNQLQQMIVDGWSNPGRRLK